MKHHTLFYRLCYLFFSIGVILCAAGTAAGFQGFDKHHYLSAKLAALQSADPSWAGRNVSALEQYLLQAGFSPQSHYALYGYREGLSPNAVFNAAEYIRLKAVQMVNSGGYSSVEEAEAVFRAAWPDDPYHHYIGYGAAEGISPSLRFDETRYLSDKLAQLTSADPQWRSSNIHELRNFLYSYGMTVVDHYLNYGAQEGLVPMPVSGISMDMSGSAAWSRYVYWTIDNVPVTPRIVLSAPAEDGGVVMAAGNSGDLLLLKLDSTGNIQWEKKYPLSTSELNFIRDFKPLPGNQGFLINGSTWDGYYLVHVDAYGTLVSNTALLNGGKMVILPNGQLAIATDYLDSSEKPGVIYGTDLAGNILWYSEGQISNSMSFLTATPSGNLVGVTSGAYEGYPISGAFKTDPNGNRIWENINFSGLTTLPTGFTGTLLPTGELVAVGSVDRGKHGIMIGLDPAGNVTWSKAFDESMALTAVKKHAVHGLIIGGEKNIGGSIYGYLSHTDEYGNPFWERIFGSDGKNTRIQDIHPLSGGGMTIVGTVYPRDQYPREYALRSYRNHFNRENVRYPGDNDINSWNSSRRSTIISTNGINTSTDGSSRTPRITMSMPSPVRRDNNGLFAARVNNQGDPLSPQIWDVWADYEEQHSNDPKTIEVLVPSDSHYLVDMRVIGSRKTNLARCLINGQEVASGQTMTSYSTAYGADGLLTPEGRHFPPGTRLSLSVDNGFINHGSQIYVVDVISNPAKAVVLYSKNAESYK